MNFQQARFNMMEQQIRPWNVLDPLVLSRLDTVPRELFTPDAQQALAYADLELSIADGQVMLAPKIQAKLVQDVQVKLHESVLQIGAGTGYMTALLAGMAKQVTALEQSSTLVKTATDNLTQLGLTNTQVLHQDASQDISALGTYDVVVVCGSVQTVPDSLRQRLGIGGRLIAIVGDAPIMQATLVTKISETGWRQETPWDTVAPRLIGFAQASRFTF